MAWTSPATVNASAGLSDFLPYLSTVTNFWFGRMLMVAVFVIFLLGYMRVRENDFIGGLAISSYITFVIGLLFWVIGLVSGIDFGVIIGITVISSIALLLQKKDY